MKHLLAVSGIAIALGIAASIASAQSSPPALPALTPAQTQELAARMDSYRRATDARVARNEITTDEASRLTQWREWQIAREISVRSTPLASGTARAPSDYASTPPDYREQAPLDDREGVPPDYYAVEPSTTYVPYYTPSVPYYPYYPSYPYYYGPRPYAYWGPSVCAGGFGRHFGGRICF